MASKHIIDKRTGVKRGEQCVKGMRQEGLRFIRTLNKHKPFGWLKLRREVQVMLTWVAEAELKN